MKNEFYLMVGYSSDNNGELKILQSEDGKPLEFRSEGKATSEGKNLQNVQKIERFKVLKLVAEHGSNL